jgi:ABC-2 type transport system permease protein
MSRLGRIRAEMLAEWLSFTRRRTAVFFTFFFPVVLIVIFGVLIQTEPGGSGLFARPTGYYVPGYLAVVVLFTPLSRVSSTVARHRAANRFERLATTPLRRWEWLLAHATVNVVLIGAACGALLGLLLALTDASIVLSPLLVPLIAAGSVVFCGIGAVLGRLADSQDGAISAANGIALPMLFLSETFVPPDMLPAWIGPLIDALPLTYFARGVRGVTSVDVAGGGTALAILVGLSAVSFVVGAVAIPWTD